MDENTIHRFDVFLAERSIHSEIEPQTERSVIAVCPTNRENNAALVFLILSRGLNVIVFPSSAKEAEIEVNAVKVGAEFLARFEGEDLVINRIAGAKEKRANNKELGIYLLTSGSTGTPSAIFRPVDTWVNEGERYITLLDLNESSNILIVSPISHAYALGWLWAGAMANCDMRIVCPKRLSEITENLRNWATHLVITPNIARLLAMRCRNAISTHLSVAMAGAGPVDEKLDENFHKAFGIKLSRNYGSTETGALFAGLAPQEPCSIGQPMPGIIIHEAGSDNEAFSLKVELEDKSVHSMGDVLRRDGQQFYIIGRETSAIRRGERWVSPFEIEGVLRSHPEVEDCQVRGVNMGQKGNDYIIASVVTNNPDAANSDDVREYCKQRLSDYKVPDVIERVSTVPRNENGKVKRKCSYEIASDSVLFDVANAYKRSHLLFAMSGSGILGDLQKGLSVDQIAFRLGRAPCEIETVLEVAYLNGILEKNAVRTPNSQSFHLIEFEAHNNRNWNSVSQVEAGISRSGGLRPFDKEPAPIEFVDSYQKLMGGSHKEMSARFTLSRLLRKKKAPVSVLDITATHGLYTSRLIDMAFYAREKSAVLHVGISSLLELEKLNVRLFDSVDDALNGNEFDLIIFDNACHYSEVSDQMSNIVSKLNEDGNIVVDDLFLFSGKAELGVDWLTHGGTRLLEVEDVTELFQKLDFNVADLSLQKNSNHKTLILSKKEKQ